MRRRLPRLERGTIEWRVAAAIAISWLVPMMLAAFARPTPGEMPFWMDIDVHTRVLVALPLLIAVEPFVQSKLSGAVLAFLRRGMVRQEERRRFLGIVVRAVKMRRSPIATVPLLILAIVLTLTGPITHRESAWGVWYGMISLSLFRFVLLRWYYWILVWYVVLWRISRLDLRLNALHSDTCAGIGFLAGSLRGFAPVMLAQSIVVAGALAYRIQEGADPKTFAAEVAAVIFTLVTVAVLPLAFFTTKLGRARGQGQRELGELSMRYVDGFRDRWIDGADPTSQPLLGTPDLQSLADLHSSYDVTTSIRLLPVSFRSILRLALLTASPFIPLSLASVPVDELASKILRQLL